MRQEDLKFKACLSYGVGLWSSLSISFLAWSEGNFVWFAFCHCYEYHHQNQLVDKRIYFILQFTVLYQQKPRQESRERDEKRNHGGTLFIALFPQVCSVTFHILLRPNCPGMTSSTHQFAIEEYPTVTSTDDLSDQENSLVWGPLLHMM